jgi:CheY-like chemotaxis protein
MSMALVLVVDDEFQIAEILAILLRDDGYEAVTVSDGNAALQFALNRRPDAVITDFMMPYMTGLELARALRGNEATADVPIMLITGGHGLLGVQHRNMFDVVVEKPFDAKRVLTLVGELVGRKANRVLGND